MATPQAAMSPHEPPRLALPSEPRPPSDGDALHDASLANLATLAVQNGTTSICPSCGDLHVDLPVLVVLSMGCALCMVLLIFVGCWREELGDYCERCCWRIATPQPKEGGGGAAEQGMGAAFPQSPAHRCCVESSALVRGERGAGPVLYGSSARLAQTVHKA